MTRDLNDPKYVYWRRRVFARDHYKCQMPGCPGGCKDLEAHHIKRWADFPRLRYWHGNGITLCIICHTRVTGFEKDYEKEFAAIVAAKSSPNFINGILQVLIWKYQKP